MGIWFPVFVILLLLYAIYRIDLLQQRVERLHAKVNVIRKTVAPNEAQHREVAGVHSVTDTIRVAEPD